MVKHPVPLSSMIVVVALGFITLIGISLFSPAIVINVAEEPGFEFKQKEKPSANKNIPVLLYHNIDGIGPFSISSKKLREQFRYIKNQGVTVISFQDLIELQKTNSTPDRKYAVISFDDGYLSSYSKLLPIAQEFDYPIVLFVYTDFIYDNAKNKMTWERLRELEKSGFDIECHTISHQDLARLSDSTDMEKRRDLFKELIVAREILELNLGKKINYIAYPYGSYNLKLLDATRLAGYAGAASTDYGANKSYNQNYLLKRHHIKSDYTLKNIEKILSM